MEASATLAQWKAVEGQAASHVDELNKLLASSVFVGGNTAADVDSALFEELVPLAKTWTSAEDVAKYRHVVRWMDFVQNTIVGEKKLEINFDVVLPREIKEKPKKKGEATEGAKDTKGAKGGAKDKAAPAATPAKPKGKPTTPEEIAAAKAAKEAKKAAKAKANAEAAAKTAAAASVPPTPVVVDLRVGFIEKAIKHPDADGLYVSTIHMGDEDGPRTVCSGLVKFVPIEEMQQRYVVVVANLKPVSMRGIKSCAMVLCASSQDHTKVEFVNPPEGSKAGDKVYFEGYEGTPEKQLNPKKKIWEAIQPSFTTLQDFSVVYRVEGKPDAHLVTKLGPCRNSTLVGAVVN